jgi:pimeloyl-ACP methyl ester carboxylesterase
LASCAGGRDSGGDAAALHHLLEEDRQAHLQLDAALLASHLADTLLSIDSGQVAPTPRREVESAFRSYFAGARYEAWEDVEPPVVRIAPGGRMAWVVRKVRVDRQQPDAGGTVRRRQFTSAWTATYEWRDRRWQMTTVTSTFVPERRSGMRAAEAPRPGPAINASPGPRRAASATGDRARRCAWACGRGWIREQSWPGVVFLHGAGECGEDGLKPTRVGLGLALLAHPERWPCVVVFPQKPIADEEWWEHESLVFAVLADARRHFGIDAKRVALAGMSQGGHGAWMIGARHPERWRCLVPVCGYGRAQTVATRIRDVPVWCFQGMQDEVVVPHETQEIVRWLHELKRSGGLDTTNIRATFYPDANHNSWDRAFAEEELPRWIAKQLAPR